MILIDTAKCLQIGQQLVKYVQNKGGSEVGLCFIDAKQKKILDLAMNGYRPSLSKYAEYLAKTALFLKGYSGKDDNPTPMPTKYSPRFYIREPGGVALMHGDGVVVGAIGVHGRQNNEVPNNHELAFWCSRFFPEYYAVRCEEDYFKLFNNHLLNKQAAPVVIGQVG